MHWLLLLACAVDPASEVTETASDAPAGTSASDTEEVPCRPAAELCDGLDNDCDGTVDEQARDRVTWYPDLDGDGFGAGTGSQGCEAPESHVDNDEDCDDGDSGIWPGAVERLDGLDGDCDDNRDRTVPSEALVTLTGSQRGESLGGVVHATDAGLLLGAPAAQEGEGVAWWVPGPLTERASVDAVGVAVRGTEAGELGTAVLVGDDGALFLGEPEDNTADLSAGRVLYFASPPSEDVDADDADGWLLGPSRRADAGRALAIADDVDGLAELVVGMPYDLAAGNGSGRVSWVTAPFTGTVALGSTEPQLVADEEYLLLGYDLVRADVDGDGLDDTLVGAPGAALRPDYGGQVLTVLAGAEGQWAPADSDGQILANAGSDFFGLALATPGDVDGDGREDWLVGAPGVDDASNAAGAAYVFQGPATGVMTADAAWATMLGDGAVDYLGQDVGAPGDLDGDGLGELLVGAFYADDGGDASGTAYLFYGVSSGVTLAEQAGVRFVGAADFDVLGVGLDASDQDGDGRRELWVGAMLSDAAQPDAGALYAWEAGQDL